MTTGQRDAVRVQLTGNAANVLVMDDDNFQNFKRGLPYQYHGGYYKKSPVLIDTPHPGRWNVVINLGGLAGTVNATVQLVHR